MAEAGHGLSAATLHAAGGAHANARRAKEEDQNPRLGQARAGLVRSASRTRKSTAWENGKGAQQRDHARQKASGKMLQLTQSQSSQMEV